jgi:hypothetical protein
MVNRLTRPPLNSRAVERLTYSGMKKKIIFLNGIFVCLTTACILAAVFPAPAPVLEWERLFVAESIFPTGWDKGEIWEVCISAPLDSGCDNYDARSVTYRRSENNYAGETVRFYSNAEIAGAGYTEWFDVAYYKYPTTTEYEWPSAVKFESDVAEQVEIGCNQTIESGRRACVFLAQYDRFIVRFSMWNQEKIDYELFQAVISEIDRQMSVYAKQPPIPTSEQ